jgi:N utilization substance protein A
MNSKALIESFAEFARQRNIDRPTMIRIIEDVFKSLIKKKYNLKDKDDESFDKHFNIIINIDNGDLQIFRFREIVDDNSEDIWEPECISLSEAKKIEPDFEVGEMLATELGLEDFGRRMVLTARQTLIQKVRDVEKERVFERYKESVGDVITAEVNQILGKEILLIDEEGNDLILPKSEQIPKDYFKKGQQVKAVVHRVEMLNGNPKIIVSRTSPVFLERLFETEVPEIYDGLITIKKIVREPGERAKVAVESYDERIDPVGACVGVKGSRIHGIVRELQNENIDVINYTDNFELLVARALSPAKVLRMKVDKEANKIAVYLKPDQVSLAIGKNGHNIKLAGKLVGMDIDVFRELDDHEDEYDVYLDEFNDEIEQWIIDELKRVGLDTAKSVLSLSKDDLVRRTDLEEETIAFVLEILQQEFEENEEEE